MNRTTKIVIGVIIVVTAIFLLNQLWFGSAQQERSIDYNVLSLKEIIALEENVKCTTSYASGGGGFKATIYTNNNRARVDYEGQNYDPNTGLVATNTSSYIVTPEQTDADYEFDINNSFFGYDCESWSVDQSVFEL